MGRIPRPGALLCNVLLVSCASLCLGHMESDDLAQSVSSRCPSTFFNFGDSLSDTGNAVLALPGVFEAQSLPYGQDFFGKPSGRASNGRLVVDFMLLAFKLPLLEPYLLPNAAEKSGHGLNFAYSGATAAPTGFHGEKYFLGYQVDDFVRLKGLALGAQQQQSLGESVDQFDQATFHNALYTICIGGNDIIYAIFKGQSPKAVIRDIVPNVVKQIVGAVRTLYDQSARKFLIFNGPPIGCATIMLISMELRIGLTLDELGCLAELNEINEALNYELYKSVQLLRATLPQVAITLFDYYAANIEILGHPTKYGFNPQVTHTACCGAPGNGPLNWNPKHVCSRPGSQTCDDPDQFLIWDGVHWTESFYRHIAKFVLNGQFADPPTNFTDTCNLSFDNFGPVTYDKVFPGSGSVSCDQ